MDTATDDLAVRLRAGDVSVARDLYREYGRLVFAVTHRVLGNPSLAEDATQQAFVQAWNARSSIDPGRGVRPWLCTIAHRCAIDLLRRESRRSHEAIDPARPQPELTVNPDLDAVWDAWRVREALDALPAEEREVVRLQHFEGYSQSEIGERLGVPVGTIKSRSHRAHRRLASALRILREVEGP